MRLLFISNRQTSSGISAAAFALRWFFVRFPEPPPYPPWIAALDRERFEKKYGVPYEIPDGFQQ